MIPFALEAAGLRLYAEILKQATSIIPLRDPTVFVGEDALQQLFAHIAERGIERLLLATDADILSLGLVDPSITALQEQGISVSVFDGISPDPNFDQVEQGAAALRAEDCEAVLAIGGGSVLDAGKLIAARANSRKPVKAMTGMLRVDSKPLPIFAVPTTAGTGAEVTVAAVVTDPQTHQKFPVVDGKLLPHAVALDGQLTLGLPPALTAATGMDVLTHAIEAYVSRAAKHQTRQYALSAARRCIKYLPRAFAQGHRDLEAREQMMLASHEAGRAINQASAGYVHAIAHQIGAMYQVPHGVANAIVLPHVLAFSRPRIDERLAELAFFCDLGDVGESNAELADKLIDVITALNERFDIPDRIKALRSEDIPSIAKGAISEARLIYAVPRPMRHRDCEQVLKCLLAV